MNDTEQILEAIAKQGEETAEKISKLIQSIASLAAQVGRDGNSIRKNSERIEKNRTKLDTHDKALADHAESIQRQGEKIAEIEKMVADLMQTDAVFRKCGQTVAFRRDPLYEALEEAGYDRKSGMDALEQTYFILRGENDRVRTRTLREDGVKKRFIVIRLN